MFNLRIEKMKQLQHSSLPLSGMTKVKVASSNWLSCKHIISAARISLIGEPKNYRNILKDDQSAYFAGIGYAMCGLSIYIGTYYNIILSWAFFYIFSSFTTNLPWASCGNWWNTDGMKISERSIVKSGWHRIITACRRFDSKNCTSHGGVMTNEEDCVFAKDVSVDVWRNLTETANNAKMPSDEFFQ